MAQRQLGQKIKDSHLKAKNRDEDRPAIGAPSEENAKKTPREETASVGPQKANVQMEKHAHSSMTRKRKAKEGTTSFAFFDRFAAPKLER